MQATMRLSQKDTGKEGAGGLGKGEEAVACGLYFGRLIRNLIHSAYSFLS